MKTNKLVATGQPDDLSRYGYGFRPSEGRVIGRRDASGKLVPVDPATLPPDVLSMFPDYDKRGKLLEKGQAQLVDR